MSLAKFSDAQFTTLNSYLTSSEFATRQNFLTQAQKDVVVLSDLGEKRYQLVFFLYKYSYQSL